MQGVSPNFLMICAVAAVGGTLAYFGLSAGRLAFFVFVIAVWVITLCLHEFGHALAAYHGGDRSVAEKGYLTLDPLKYTHPLLSIGLPLLFLAMGGIGLPGGAVYVHTNRLRSRAWISLVSAAGPVFTLLCLVALLIPLRLGLYEAGGTHGFWAGISLLAFLQLTALLFNLLPIPGLDGFGIIEPWLPRALQPLANALRSGPIMLVLIVVLVMTPAGGAFFRFLFDLAETLGIAREDIVIGLQLFQIWR